MLYVKNIFKVLLVGEFCVSATKMFEIEIVFLVLGQPGLFMFSVALSRLLYKRLSSTLMYGRLFLVDAFLVGMKDFIPEVIFSWSSDHN